MIRDPSGLGGLVVVVTGGSSGIGLATSRHLAQAESSVLIVGRDKPRLRDAVAEMARSKGDTAWFATDLRDPLAPQAVIANAISRFGAVDSVVNCAAIVRTRPLPDWSSDDIDEHWAINVRAPFLLVQSALPWLTESDRASVVNVSSSSARLALAGQSVYGMTKAALEYLTKSMARELAPLGVRVNAVAPGPTNTPIHSTWSDDLPEAHRWLASQIPLNRIASPDEVARVICFLLSSAASFMNGATVAVDGGQTA